jgi:uncharacterized damage-inducible protein DinB
MKQEAVTEQWTYFNKVLGVTRKLLEQLPEDQLNFRPTEGSRTASEIVAHAYGMITDAVQMVATGTYAENPAPTFSSKAELIRWTEEQVEKGLAGFSKLTEAQMMATISAFGDEFPAWQMLDFTYQEHLHHRGQLTVYLRMMGLTPHSIYDF